MNAEGWRWHMEKKWRKLLRVWWNLAEKMLSSGDNNQFDQAGKWVQLSNTARLGVFHVHRCCARASWSRAASWNWRKEPLVTPSLYGAVLRKGLKSRFGAPTLLPQTPAIFSVTHQSCSFCEASPWQTRLAVDSEGAARSGGNRHTPESATTTSSQQKTANLSQLDGQNGLLDGPDSGLSAATARGRPGFEWVPLYDVWRCFLLVFFLAFLCMNYLKCHYIFTCHND